VLLTGTAGWVGVIVAGIVALAVVFGDALGGRYAAETSLKEQAELRRQDLAWQAVLEERARIARELHDVVAHHMSVIALQAEAAPYKIEGLPPAARDTFVVIRGAAREALAETRRVVGLLRSDGEGAERVPQPGLERLDELVSWAEQAGLTVKRTIVGIPRQLSAGVDLSAYRIVQEALSNAARYAPGTHIDVEIRYAEDRLHVAVTDDGPRGGEPESSGGGHGLVGMHERVAMLGGELTAGPRAAGGFEVRAELPYGNV
jgi:signal transduction histidine kinase